MFYSNNVDLDKKKIYEKQQHVGRKCTINMTVVVVQQLTGSIAWKILNIPNIRVDLKKI